jgi:indole-3-glycerol phosphate synthase
MSDILNKILAVKREEVAAAQASKPLAGVRAEAEAQAPARDFVGAIRAKVWGVAPSLASLGTATSWRPAQIGRAHV